MKTKEKNFLVIVLLLIFAIIVMMPVLVVASDSTTNVSSAEEFIDAVNNTTNNITLTADIDLTDAGVLDVSGRTINLNGHKIEANNFTLIFQGSNFTIKNGTLKSNPIREDQEYGSYALFIGDDVTTNVVIEDITAIGGINIYNSTNVVIKNSNVTGTNYYAIWCDEGGQATIKSGTYKTNGVAVIGMSAEEYETDLQIEGGTFITNGKPLVLQGNYNTPTISGGNFDVEIPAEYWAEGYELVNYGDGNYGVCNHSTTYLKNKISATCTSSGYTGDTYCSNCDLLIELGSVTSATGHISSEWKFDEEKHWQECTDCGDIISESEGAHIDEDGDGKCDICGYEKDKINTDNDIENNTTTNKKDNTPKTNAIESIYFILPIMVISTLGIVIAKKKRAK